jgi:4-hydroxybenzoyl-CoA reductase subunit alpha
MHRGRHPVLMKFRTGRDEGRHAHRHAPADAARRRRLRLLRGGEHVLHRRAADGHLRPAALQVRGCRVFTNKPPCGPKRGHGTPQPRFGQEVQLDKIAEKLGLDPAELRLGMVTKPDSLTANWLKIGSIGLAECIATGGRDVGGWSESAAASCRTGAAWASPAVRTCAARGCRSTGTRCRTRRADPARSQRQVTVFCGATEIGQGSDDVLAALVAEVLGIDPFTCAASPATPASRRSTSARTPAASP